MTAPGGASGESAHDDEANPPPAGEPAPEHTPWEPPAASPAADYPPPAYPPPSYPPGYSPENPAGYPIGYPEPSGPTGYTPPGNQQPSGGSSYPPGPPQFGAPPPGYGPPGGGAQYPGEYPGSYYPTSDYLGGYGLPPGLSQPGTNAMAIASLISSFTGLLCCIGSVVAIVLGIIALDQIKRTRQEGYGLAVAGIVIGIVTLAVSLVGGFFLLHSR